MQISNQPQSVISALNNNMPTRQVQQEVSTSNHQNNDSVNVSNAGKIKGYIDSLPQEQQAEMKNFMQSIRESKQSGTFSAQDVAENAPQAFNDMANALGKSPEELLTSLPDKPPKRRESSQGTAALASYQQTQNVEDGLLDKMMKWFDS